MMKLKYMWKNDCVADIEYDFMSRKVFVINYTDVIWKRPFGVHLDPSFQDFENFLESRCFPKDRVNRDQLLEDMGLFAYSPYGIVKIMHGVQSDDYGWILFEDEDLDYERDIKLRD